MSYEYLSSWTPAFVGATARKRFGPMRLRLSVIPKSGRSELKIVGKTLKAWLKSAPADGKANEELVRMLAEKFDVRKAAVEIVSGFSSRNKVVDILGVSDDEIKKIL